MGSLFSSVWDWIGASKPNLFKIQTSTMSAARRSDVRMTEQLGIPALASPPAVEHPDPHERALMYKRFEFEGAIHDTLECVPMSVRRKLDLATLKISLAGWQALSRAERLRAPRPSTRSAGMRFR